MKRLFPLLLLSVFLIFPSIASAQVVTKSDGSDVAQVIRVIVTAINEDDANTIITAISENAESGLSDSITSSLAAGSIEFSITTDTLTLNDDGTFTVKANFSSIQEGKELNRLSVYFDFEHVDGAWWLLDTNFPDKLSSSTTMAFVEVNSWKFIGITALTIIILLFLYFKFRKIDDDEEEDHSSEE